MIISVKEVRDKILAEVFEVYIKCLFLEKYYSNLFYYIFSPYGNYTIEYFYNKIINQISPDDIQKFSSILPEGEFEATCKRSIEEIISVVTDNFKNTEKNKVKFINNLKVTECPIDVNATTETEEDVFDEIEKINYYFYLEYFLKIAENNHNRLEYKLRDVVNVKYFTSYPDMDNLYTQYEDIKYGLRLMYKQNNTDNGETGSENLKQKCFNVKKRGRSSICTIPIISFETENIRKDSLTKFKQDIQIQNQPNEQKYVKILKEQIINSDEYNKVFLKIFPIDMIDIMLASKFYMSSKLFEKILKQNNIYTSSSEVVLRLLNSLVTYKEIQV